jgi:hypothetical protein
LSTLSGWGRKSFLEGSKVANRLEKKNLEEGGTRRQETERDEVNKEIWRLILSS